MYFYQSRFLNYIFVFAVGLIFIITPTALTTASVNNTNSFYPDLFLCFIFSSALNRPKTINLYLILFLLLFSDILQMKPIGLLTILLLTCIIVIKRYQLQLENSSFFIHYVVFFTVVSCLQILNLFLHHIFFIPKLSFFTVLNQTIFLTKTLRIINVLLRALLLQYTNPHFANTPFYL